MPGEQAMKAPYAAAVKATGSRNRSTMTPPFWQYACN